MMYHLESQSTFNYDSEHVFSLFYEIKLEHPFIDESALMNSINRITGWEYQASRKNEIKQLILKKLLVKN